MKTPETVPYDIYQEIKKWNEIAERKNLQLRKENEQLKKENEERKNFKIIGELYEKEIVRNLR